MNTPGQQNPNGLDMDSLLLAAADARRLLAKLSCRFEIDDGLRAEISQVEDELWFALFPGARGIQR